MVKANGLLSRDSETRVRQFDPDIFRRRQSFLAYQYLFARMTKLVDVADSKSVAVRRVGSSPARNTNAPSESCAGKEAQQHLGVV